MNEAKMSTQQHTSLMIKGSIMYIWIYLDQKDSDKGVVILYVTKTQKQYCCKPLLTSSLVIPYI